MKKLLIVLAMVLMASTSYAAPFLVCDPVAAGTWDQIEIVMDGAAPIRVTPVVMSPTDPRIRLHYDLNAVSVGNHSVVLRGIKGVWPSPPTPFSFARPAVASPTGIGLAE